MLPFPKSWFESHKIAKDEDSSGDCPTLDFPPFIQRFFWSLFFLGWTFKWDWSIYSMSQIIRVHYPKSLTLLIFFSVFPSEWWLHPVGKLDRVWRHVRWWSSAEVTCLYQSSARVWWAQLHAPGTHRAVWCVQHKTLCTWVFWNGFV